MEEEFEEYEDMYEEYIDEDDMYQYEDYNDDDDIEYEYEYDDTYEDTDIKQSESSNKIKKHLTIKKKYIKPFILVLAIILLVFGIVLNTNSNSTKLKKEHKNTELVTNNEVDFNKLFKMIKKDVLNHYNKDNFNTSGNKLTLKELKDLNYLKNINKNIDLNSSIVEINSKDNEYELKISLHSNKVKIKKYTINNYIYCKNTYLCEKSMKKEKKQYEYLKNETNSLSAWSKWTNTEETSCDTSEIKCNNDDYNCLKEIQITTKEEENAKQDVIYGTTRAAFKTIGKEIINGCIYYDYIKVTGTYYRTEKNSNYRQLGNIKKDTKASYYNWKYLGRSSYYNPPNDTVNTRYVYVGADYSNCGETCDTHPKYIYDSYTFVYPLIQVDNPTNDCSMPELKLVANYSIENQDISVSRKEIIKETKCYISTRTRTINSSAKETKWSKYEDKKLLDNGYIYTGNNK